MWLLHILRADVRERYEGQIFALFGKTYIFISVKIYRVNLLMNSLIYILHIL